MAQRRAARARSDKDDPALGGDLQRTTFSHRLRTPGYRCPIGAHIRRMNPRDTAENMRRRKMIRRGGHGPPLPPIRRTTAWNRASPRSSAVLIRQFNSQ
jgi:hypothetical protein